MDKNLQYLFSIRTWRPFIQKLILSLAQRGLKLILRSRLGTTGEQDLQMLEKYRDPGSNLENHKFAVIVMMTTVIMIRASDSGFLLGLNRRVTNWFCICIRMIMMPCAFTDWDTNRIFYANLFWATVCLPYPFGPLSVLSVLSCLSVTLEYCGQTVT